jgi:hypothetical protein
MFQIVKRQKAIICHLKYNFSLDLIYYDVWGPVSIISTTGARYHVSFHDDCTKFLLVFPMKFKSDDENIFFRIQAHVE